ncbi:ATP synthase F0 subunit B [Desulfovibrio litoralis]|uniref:ATP synthase subunit b n=1 Tax=Desulfovibrio litoralis DSM 11393 TaxID=1121455 RepID=A0A1M7S8E7_9BACT|nr:ATP synthase F0 subunit B [Desulfovibrio litoralis]SHN54644.1 F-type H+-transporting ATPase subunit b [Desulfovibrio litoralis DSM 11393]
MKKDKVFLVLLALAVVSLGAGLVHGIGEANQSAVTNLFFRLANLFAFAGIIWYFGVKKMLVALKARRSTIEQELKDLSQRKLEAEQKLAEVERRIANIASEREAVFAEYKAQGEMIKKNIIAKAEATAKQITEQAKLTAENELALAIEEIRSEVADLVVENTEKMLKAKLNSEAQEKIIDNYITKVVLN